MIRLASIILLILLIPVYAFSDTTYVAPGNVTGVWTTGNSPYIVQGDIILPTGSSMTIMPGVEVRFTGNFKFTIQGLLYAEGTETDSITFTRHFPTEQSKWRGFRFDAADDASMLAFCRIEYAKGEGAYPDVRGGCVWISYCSPTVRHCLIRYGYTHNGNSNGCGGGVCLNQNSYSIIEYNTIRDNQSDSGGGVFVGSGCDALIKDNLIDDNQAFYAGGGIYVAANGEAQIYNNIISANSCTGGFGGGGINLWCATWLYGTYCYVYNNLIVDNSASAGGGGIYTRYETSNTYCNTIAGNSAAQGGGIYVITFSNYPPIVYNCIVWNNTGGSIFLYEGSGSAADVTYCDVQGGWPGAGNINADPLFAIAPQGQYFLSQTAAGQTVQSPCVDAGNPAFTPIVGSTRTDLFPDTGVVDLGYHYTSETTIPALEVFMNPNQVPTIIPASGGNFLYEIEISNIDNTAVQFDAWIMAQLPNGSLFGPFILRQGITLQVGGFIYRENLSQSVPVGAPPGDYLYIANVGEYPDDIYASDNFPFEKLAHDNNQGFEIADWTLSGWDRDSYRNTLTPDNHLLLSAYPNPFNSSTTVTFTLPSAGSVELAVYNLPGREVVTLSEGLKPAGVHEVHIDGSQMTSGVYFIRLSADNRQSTVKKVILVK